MIEEKIEEIDLTSVVMRVYKDYDVEEALKKGLINKYYTNLPISILESLISGVFVGEIKSTRNEHAFSYEEFQGYLYPAEKIGQEISIKELRSAAIDQINELKEWQEKELARNK